MSDDARPVDGELPNPLAMVDHLVALADGRSRLLRLIEGLDDAGGGRVVHGEWRVHDLLSHLAAWDELVTDFLERLARGEREFELAATPEDDWAEFNAGAVDAARGEPWSVRRERLERSREALLEAVYALDEATLDASVVAPWGTDDVIRGHIVAQALHDARHADDIASALGAPASSG